MNRRRKERRRVNERKAKDVLKLQLNMTTPMELGLERQDGMEEMFSLKAIDGKDRSLPQTGHLESDDEIDADGVRVRSPSIELDSDEEDEEAARRVKKLEGNLDELYDEYQNRKLERDAKHKVKLNRAKARMAEGGEWQGIKEDGSDAEEDEDDSGDELVRMPAAESDSDTDSDDEMPSTSDPKASKKRARNGRLITDLRDEKAQAAAKSDKAKAAAVWYDQPVFKNVPGLAQLLQVESDDEKENEGAGAVRFAAQNDVADDEVSIGRRPSVFLAHLFTLQVMEWSTDEEDAGSVIEEVPLRDEQAEEDKSLSRAART